MFTIHAEENENSFRAVSKQTAEPAKKPRKALGDISLNTVNVTTPAGKAGFHAKPASAFKAHSSAKVRVESYYDPKDMICPGISTNVDPFSAALEQSLKYKGIMCKYICCVLILQMKIFLFTMELRLERLQQM